MSKLFTTAAPVVRLSSTTPNARCPVCQAVVFFYESPYGGRVFFDELGPPWPKHPCTDNTPERQGASYYGDVEEITAPSNYSPSWRQEGWEPLDVTAVERGNSRTVLHTRLDGSTSFWVKDRFRYSQGDPILARRSPRGDGSWEVSYLPINSRILDASPDTVTAYPRFGSHQLASVWQFGMAGDAKDRNQIGMWLSFDRRFKNKDGSQGYPGNTDWAAAELHFLMAAAGGHWAGFHNLGTMYRHGLGVRLDRMLAFHFLLRAAELADEYDCEASIKALGELYELGMGTDDDREDAIYILQSWALQQGQGTAQ